MALTMEDVAKEARISRPTVSLILNGRGDDLRISAATQQRVLEVAERLGYRCNALARAVSRGRSNVVAFIGGTDNSSYVMEILAGINTALQRQNYLLKMFILDEATSLSQVTQQCLEQMVAGVVCRSLSEVDLQQLRLDLEPAGIVVVQVDNSFSQNWCGRVVSDDVLGGRLATEHLLALGHRRIGLLSILPETTYGLKRGQGYHDALASAGVQAAPEWEVALPSLWSWDTDQAQVLTGYLKEVRPTALFCVSDPLAMKALLAASAAGLDVPSDLSVVGYGDVDYTALSNPPLTTVAQPFVAMGESAADAVLDSLRDGHDVRQVDCKLPVQLITRQTTAAPRSLS